jgi:hypothetical protein
VWPIRADELRMLEGTCFRNGEIDCSASKDAACEASGAAREHSRQSREEKSAELDKLTVPQLTIGAFVEGMAWTGTAKPKADHGLAV